MLIHEARSNKKGFYVPTSNISAIFASKKLYHAAIRVRCTSLEVYPAAGSQLVVFGERLSRLFLGKGLLLFQGRKSD
jgi:hypothetical protein